MVEKKEPQTTSESAGRHWKSAFFKLILLVLLAGAAYGLWKNPQIVSQIRSAISAPEEKTQEQTLRQQVFVLQSQIQELQNHVRMLGSGVPGSAEQFAAMNDKIAAIEKTNLNVIDSKADVATVLGLLTRVDKHEQQIDKLAKVTDSSALTLTAVLLVKDSAERGGNYEYEMEVLQQIAGDEPRFRESLKEMEKYSAQGIASQEQLKKEFAAIYKHMLKAQKDEFDQTWQDRINTKLSEIVQIKRVNGEKPKFEADAGLEKIRQDVETGRLPEAVNELKLPANAGLLQNAALKAWLQKAEARLSFYQAVAKISAGSMAIMKVKFLKPAASLN